MARKRMRWRAVFACAVIGMAMAACAKPMVSATVKPDVDYVNRDYAAVPNDIYYAARWALGQRGYPIANENLAEGVLTTAWVPVGATSHYIPLFNRHEYGVTDSYHQLEVQIVPGGGRTEVRVGSRIKSLAAMLKSSGTEERKILDDIGAYLRKAEPAVTNLGMEE